MELKKGFKQTEIGLIPEDWDVVLMNEITLFMTNGFVGVAKLYYSSSDDSILYIQGYNVKENSFNFNGIKRVTKAFHYKNSKSNLKKDDLLTVQTGDVGLTTIVPKELEGSNCHALIISRFKKSKAAPKFYSFYLNSTRGRARLKEIETGTTMKHINVGDLVWFQVPFPPIQEQKVIAQVLTDTDQLIQSLKTLIAKKKAIKQGAMQELLTGKKRLKGFTGEWEIKRLGELGKTLSGLSGKTKTDFENGIYPYITFLNVMNNVKIDTSIFGYVHIKQGEAQNRFFKGDLFFNTSSETPEEVGMCSVLLDNIENLHLNSFCFGYRLFEKTETDGLFLSYLINSSVGRELFNSLAQGATRYNLSKSNFNKVNIYVPEFKEQKAIAQILSDMDAELEALVIHLQKTQQLKQGMMQELLTGKIRLVRTANQEKEKFLAMAAEPESTYKNKSL